MFKKVLIAEDFDSVNISVRKTLEDLGVTISTRDHVSYCDDALKRVKKAIQEIDPYELLITDLSFDADSIPQEISNGIDLIKAIKQLQPAIKVLVFSMDNRASVADKLFDDLRIDAYVPKGRGDNSDLKSAVEAVYSDKRHRSLRLQRDSKEKDSYKFSEIDKTILRLIAEGKSQKEISAYLEENQIKPWSLSSIEKNLKDMKISLNITNTFQLIAYCKDNNVI